MSDAKNQQMAHDMDHDTGNTEGMTLDEMAEEEIDFGSPSVEADLLRAELDEVKDRLLRTLAESENVRKRADRDRREGERFGGTKLARDMLPIYDNLHRALDAAGDEQRAAASGVIEGIELTLRELLSVFAKHGVTPISPQVGDTFDPQLHQAMFEAPLPGTKAGEIIQVTADGFLLHDRLLRPAQVGVSSNTAG